MGLRTPPLPSQDTQSTSSEMMRSRPSSNPTLTPKSNLLFLELLLLFQPLAQRETPKLVLSASPQETTSPPGDSRMVRLPPKTSSPSSDKRRDPTLSLLSTDLQAQLESQRPTESERPSPRSSSLPPQEENLLPRNPP